MSRWGWGRVLLLELSPVSAPSPLHPGPLPLDFSLCFCVSWSFGDFWSPGHAHLLAIAGSFSQCLTGCHHLTRTSGWLRCEQRGLFTLCPKACDGVEGSLGSQPGLGSPSSPWSGLWVGCDRLAGCQALALRVDAWVADVLLLSLEGVVLGLSHTAHCVQHSLQ